MTWRSAFALWTRNGTLRGEDSTFHHHVGFSVVVIWILRRRLLLPAAVAALAVIQVTGCGGSDTSTSASATTAAAAQPTANDGAYVSVSDALAVVREHVEVPVAIPSRLPAGVTALDPVVHRGTAQLTLAVPGEGFRLVIL